MYFLLRFPSIVSDGNILTVLAKVRQWRDMICGVRELGQWWDLLKSDGSVLVCGVGGYRLYRVEQPRSRSAVTCWGWGADRLLHVLRLRSRSAVTRVEAEEQIGCNMWLGWGADRLWHVLRLRSRSAVTCVEAEEQIDCDMCWGWGADWL